jgi:hypothetical protein
MARIGPLNPLPDAIRRVMFNPAVITESTCSYEQARRLFACPPSFRSIKRWTSEGRRTRRCPKATTLEWCYSGATPVTSREAVRRFQARINGVHVPQTAPHSPLTLSPPILDCLRRMEEAMTELRRRLTAEGTPTEDA